MVRIDDQFIKFIYDTHAIGTLCYRENILVSRISQRRRWFFQASVFVAK
jgi:hypothetical protein